MASDITGFMETHVTVPRLPQRRQSNAPTSASQTASVPSAPQETSIRESRGAKLSAWMLFSWAGHQTTGSDTFAATFVSCSALSTQRGSICAWLVRNSTFLVASTASAAAQTRIRASVPPVARRSPSGDHARDWTQLECLLGSVMASLPVLVSQIFTVPSALADASRESSGEYASRQIVSAWPDMAIRRWNSTRHQRLILLSLVAAASCFWFLVTASAQTG
mmetsp:Transcript_71911/g.214619  ORF Transcript_71911/g.214619 Transcript_71911/m.214619 type:complete len:221 (+) Transcript_71911:503-1165(+)